MDHLPTQLAEHPHCGVGWEHPSGLELPLSITEAPGMNYHPEESWLILPGHIVTRGS
jgi:hypothetical protein